MISKRAEFIIRSRHIFQQRISRFLSLSLIYDTISFLLLRGRLLIILVCRSAEVEGAAISRSVFMIAFSCSIFTSECIVSVSCWILSCADPLVQFCDYSEPTLPILDIIQKRIICIISIMSRFT